MAPKKPNAKASGRAALGSYEVAKTKEDRTWKEFANSNKDKGKYKTYTNAAKSRAKAGSKLVAGRSK